MDEHKEIKELKNLIEQFRISVEITDNKYLANDYDYIQLEIILQDKQFNLFVQDEYEDLKEENQPLCLCLVLLELEEYMEEDEYSAWCNARKLPAGNVEVRDYYIDLRTTYSAIEQIIGVIESPVSPSDFKQNTEIVKALRKLDNH